MFVPLFGLYLLEPLLLLSLLPLPLPLFWSETDLAMTTRTPRRFMIWVYCGIRLQRSLMVYSTPLVGVSSASPLAADGLLSIVLLIITIPRCLLGLTVLQTDGTVGELGTAIVKFEPWYRRRIYMCINITKHLQMLGRLGYQRL